VFALLAGGFFENVAYLGQALFMGAAGEIGVAVAGLGLAGKRGEQISGRPALSEFTHDKPPLFFDLDGLRHALGGCLANQVMVLLRDLVKFDDGQQLVLVVFENLRAKLVAVAVAHTLPVDANFHLSLLNIVL
jgi:hypothetical protein